MEWVCLGWLAGYGALIGYENRLYLHYVIVAMPPLILLSAPAVGWLWARIRSPEPWLRRVAFGLWAGTAAMLVVAGAFTVEATAATLADASSWRSASVTTARLAARQHSGVGEAIRVG